MGGSTTYDKKVIIFAGPNGAGKTTFARTFLPAEAGVPIFVNADLIAAGLSPFDPVSHSRRRCPDTHIYAESMHGARVGSWWSLIFLSLGSADEAISRVAMRSRHGGHDIPADVIRRRFATGMRNFVDIYRHRVDFWQLYDNRGWKPRLIEEGFNQ